MKLVDINQNDDNDRRSSYQDRIVPSVNIADSGVDMKIGECARKPRQYRRIHQLCSTITFQNVIETEKNDASDHFHGRGDVSDDNERSEEVILIMFHCAILQALKVSESATKNDKNIPRERNGTLQELFQK